MAFMFQSKMWLLNEGLSYFDLCIMKDLEEEYVRIWLR